MDVALRLLHRVQACLFGTGVQALHALAGRAAASEAPTGMPSRQAAALVVVILELRATWWKSLDGLLGAVRVQAARTTHTAAPEAREPVAQEPPPQAPPQAPLEELLHALPRAQPQRPLHTPPQPPPQQFQGL